MKSRYYQHPAEWDAVRTWWRERLISGRVLAGNYHVEGEDYLGSMPWPRWVSLAALHTDCVTEKRVPMSRLEFSYKFRKLVNIGDRYGKSFDNPWHVSKLYYDLSDYRPMPFIISRTGT